MLLMANHNWAVLQPVRTITALKIFLRQTTMNAATISTQSLKKTGAAVEQKPSIWRRMFDAWVRSYESRISPDGKVLFLDL
jgi:hypothetical protein